MAATGYDGTPKAGTRSLFSRFADLRERYRVHVSATLAVLAALTFIAAEVVPAVQQYILSSGVLQYVVLIVVADLAISVHLQRAEPSAGVVRNQDESMPRLVDGLPECRNDSVDLLEYAGWTTLPLIRAIARAGVPMRMLVKHPETVGGMQKQRMITTLDTLYNSIVDDYKVDFEIRCYRLPYTLRGRRMGKAVLELGWLTPDIRRQTAYGHDNPSVIADLSTSSNEHLRSFFQRTFDDLWNADDTEDGRLVLARLGSSAGEQKAETGEGAAAAAAGSPA